jgi:hypothetical protein
MKLHTILFILLLILIAAPMRASSITSQCRFDPDGYFYIKGDPPRGFEEFDYLQLRVTGPNRWPTVESRVFAKGGRTYPFTKLGEFQTHASGRGIIFEFSTEKIAEVHYQFSGKFTSICVFADTERDPENVVAVGRLLKFKNGKQKAAADVELTYSSSPRQQTSSQSMVGSDPEAGTGREVLAIVRKIEPKAYTDDLGNGKVLVSDVMRFQVVEPQELTHITVTSYYRGVPEVQGRRLQVGDRVRFELPSGVQRDGILLADLKGLRFRE